MTMETPPPAPPNDPPDTHSNDTFQDPSPNDLTVLSTALLLTADCMGTGILSLPSHVATLGRTAGLAFLVLNLPVNLYAGTILGWCALFVEERVKGFGEVVNRDDSRGETERKKTCSGRQNMEYSSVKAYELSVADDLGLAVSTFNRKDKQSNPGGELFDSEYEMCNSRMDHNNIDDINHNHDGNCDNESTSSIIEDKWHDEYNMLRLKHSQRDEDTATLDFVGMTSFLFDEPLPLMTDQFQPKDTLKQSDKETGHATYKSHSSHYHRTRSITYNHPFTVLVQSIYYINLFLVLGNYILVMSHAVAAMVGEETICLPVAGIIASTLMFGLIQLRTMANLGRSVSVASLLALFIAVLQCLYALASHHQDTEPTPQGTASSNGTTAGSILEKLSSLAGIGFAVGSQKLLLNIRHEMVDRTKAAPHSLSISLAIYGTAYVSTCLLAGENPPPFLFDAIPVGVGRRVAGCLLWIHVAVSYAINSQALCSSLDRRMVDSWDVVGMGGRHRVRWLLLTAGVATASYLVANAVPFFKDLVALCGALTSVPLTLILPAVFYRRVQCVPLIFPTLHSKCSYTLLVFSLAFMIAGLIGAIGSIEMDWKKKRRAFSCS